MTVGGWIFMSVSIAFVLGLCTFCFYKVLSKPSTPEHLHSPYTIETRDDES